MPHPPRRLYRRLCRPLVALLGMTAPPALAQTDADPVRFTHWTAQEQQVYQEPDYQFVKDPSVFRARDGRYYMYYTGSAAGFHGASPPPWRIDSAVSDDGENWKKHTTAFTAENDTWEQGRVQAPSKPVWHNGRYYLFYAGGPRKPTNICRIGYATSKDLVTWTKHPEPVVAQLNKTRDKANDPFVYHENGVFYLFYTTYPKGEDEAVFFRTSNDLQTWSEPHPTGAWGEGVVIWKEDGSYYLLGAVGYSARGEEYHLFTARSLTEFQHHGPLKMNIPAFAASSWGHGDLLLEQDTVYLYFQGTKNKGKTFEIGRARGVRGSGHKTQEKPFNEPA